MQWVGVPLEIGAIMVYGEKGRTLFDYVKTCAGYYHPARGGKNVATRAA